MSGGTFSGFAIQFKIVRLCFQIHKLLREISLGVSGVQEGLYDFVGYNFNHRRLHNFVSKTQNSKICSTAKESFQNTTNTTRTTEIVQDTYYPTVTHAAQPTADNQKTKNGFNGIASHSQNSTVREEGGEQKQTLDEGSTVQHDNSSLSPHHASVSPAVSTQLLGTFPNTTTRAAAKQTAGIIDIGSSSVQVVIPVSDDVQDWPLTSYDLSSDVELLPPQYFGPTRVVAANYLSLGATRSWGGFLVFLGYRGFRV